MEDGYEVWRERQKLNCLKALGYCTFEEYGGAIASRVGMLATERHSSRSRQQRGQMMSFYRLYFMSSFSGHIERFEEFDADNDAQALTIAKAQQGTLAMELWCSHRRVEQFAAVDLASELIAQRRKLKKVKHQLETDLPAEDTRPESRKA